MFEPYGILVLLDCWTMEIVIYFKFVGYETREHIIETQVKNRSDYDKLIATEKM